ncbi:uncharacterized protein LOC135207147 [Macrobrachium nipponense]|uniref:uncharacterized protein LOC135207147 n=1 Tax=Macrobrachium nipponense TaxID=159736 RepID=UPI0030C8AF92
MLWNHMKEKGFKFLLTNRINQDCLENFFSVLRSSGGNNDTPSSYKIKTLIKNALCNNLMKNNVKGNCIDDNTPILQYLKICDLETKLNKSDFENKDTVNLDCPAKDEEQVQEFFENLLEGPVDNSPVDLIIDEPEDDESLKVIQEFVSSFNPNNDDNVATEPVVTKSIQDFICNFDPFAPDNSSDTPKDNISDYRHNLIEKNAVTYIAGYVCHKLLKHHKCDACKSVLICEDGEDFDSNNLTLFLGNKDMEKRRWLWYPSTIITNIINDYESAFQSNIVELIIKDNVKHNLTQVIKQINVDNLNVCDGVVDKVIDIFLKMRIYYYVKFLNRTLRKRKHSGGNYSGPRKNRKLTKISHI